MDEADADGTTMTIRLRPEDRANAERIMAQFAVTTLAGAIRLALKRAAHGPF